MDILKFGGSSLSDGKRILDVVNIILTRSTTSRLGIVLSAVGGVTNGLVDSIHEVLAGKAPSLFVGHFHQRHQTIIDTLFHEKNTPIQKKLLLTLDRLCCDYQLLLQGIQLIHECPESIYAQILALGEKISVELLASVLQTKTNDLAVLESADFIKTTGPLCEGIPLLDEIDRCFKPYQKKGAHILLMAGFSGSNKEGKTTLLGRNGSDYSAALMAKSLRATSCEIWTDVDGFFTADPRLVAEATLIEEMSYAEAMELAFYGANVVHPRTITPLMPHNIPIVIRNSLNLAAKGTVIQRIVSNNMHSLRGISCLEHSAMINISGPGILGTPGIAARIFTAISKHNISIILITQSSSEYSICLCVMNHEAAHTKEIISEELALEIKENLITSIDVLKNQAILCIVGEQMRHRRGAAKTFFTALELADVNVVAIAQGSSECSISAVIDGNDAHLALNKVHQFFFNTLQEIDVFLCGVGGVGGKLLAQIEARKHDLLQQNVSLRVCGIANSKKMLLAEKGLALETWRTDLNNAAEKNNLDHMVAFAQKARSKNSVLIDCTSSEDLAHHYLSAFSARMHVVAANKKANTGSMTYYRALREKANQHHRRFLYETNVGAGLPIIDTLQNLLKSGDRLNRFSGILSGSLSFIFGLLEEGVLFSEAIAEARAKHFTEPDPRDDLSGMDVARKLLILKREATGQGELTEVHISSLFPDDFDMTGEVDVFMNNLKKLDSFYCDRVNALKASGKVMRYVGEINEGICRVGIAEVNEEHPFYTIKGGENAFAFYTDRYAPIPLVVRGYGAGTDVTAAGVFADVLRTILWNRVGEGNGN